MTGTAVGSSEDDWPGDISSIEEELWEDRLLIDACQGISFMWFLPGWPLNQIIKMMLKNATIMLPVKIRSAKNQPFRSLKLIKSEFNLETTIRGWPTEKRQGVVILNKEIDPNIIFIDEILKIHLMSNHFNPFNRMCCLLIAAQIADKILEEDVLDHVRKTIFPRPKTLADPLIYEIKKSFGPLLESQQIVAPLLEEIFDRQKDCDESTLSQIIIDAAIAAYAPFVPYVAADELAKTI